MVRQGVSDLKLLHGLLGCDSSQDLILARFPLKQLLIGQDKCHGAVGCNVDGD